MSDGDSNDRDENHQQRHDDEWQPCFEETTNSEWRVEREKERRGQR